MEKCYFCRKGILENKKVTVDFRWGDKLFVIEEVPAKVCNVMNVARNIILLKFQGQWKRLL